MPGGKVENGETLSNALKREMLEETGLLVDVGDLLLVADTDFSFPYLLHIVFLSLKLALILTESVGNMIATQYKM